MNEYEDLFQKAVIDVLIVLIVLGTLSSVLLALTIHWAAGLILFTVTFKVVSLVALGISARYRMLKTQAERRARE